MKGRYPECRKNGWSKAEDALLFEAVEYTGSTKLKAWVWLVEHGVTRTKKAVNNRWIYLNNRNKPKVEKIQGGVVKGWGLYV